LEELPGPFRGLIMAMKGTLGYSPFTWIKVLQVESPAGV